MRRDPASRGRVRASVRASQRARDSAQSKRQHASVQMSERASFILRIRPQRGVGIYRAFFFWLHNHIINIYIKKFSGEVKDSVNSPIFFNLISFIKLYSPI